MSRAVGRALAAALIAGLLGPAFAALFYAWHSALIVDFDRDLPPRNATGVFPSERDDATGLTFAWTGGNAVLRLPALDRRSAWTLEMRLRGGRPAGANPAVQVLADGVVVSTVESGPEWTDLRVALPPRPDRRGLVVELRLSSTFTPGGSDPRALGVMLDRLSLTSSNAALVPRPVLAATSLASAAMGAALALLGVTAGSAIGGAVLLAAGAGAVVSRGFGPFTSYPDTVTALGLWIAIGLAASTLLRHLAGGQPLRNTAKFAAAFAASALFLKLLVLLHPDMPIGDAMFHAHRFQGVLAGRLMFTSIAPGGYAFPYPPGLYVFAAAFSGLVHRGAGDVVLLRIVTAAVDSAASIFLYWVVAAVWRQRLAAAISVAIYHLIPLDFAVLTTANLTNAFAQSIAAAALAVMGSDVLDRRRTSATMALAALLSIAYLSHTSTFAIVLVATAAIAALFFIRGEGLRGAAASIAIATALAAIAAVTLYYVHFIDTYRTELARIGTETASNAADAGGRTIGGRLAGVPYGLRINFGLAVLLLGAYGVALRARARDRLTQALFGWLLACLVFLVLGILTPVDMRYYLAAVPAIAVLAGGAAAWAWSQAPAATRTLWRIGAAVLLGTAVATGIQFWWRALG